MPLSEETKRRMELVKTVVNNSPFYRHLNMTLEDYDEGKSTLEIPIVTHHTNLYGQAHGGVVASIADSASGLALASLLEPGQVTVTLDMRINYIAPVKEGLLVASGEILHRGGATAVGSVRVTQKDKLVAAAMVTHYIVQRSPIDLEEKSKNL